MATTMQFNTPKQLKILLLFFVVIAIHTSFYTPDGTSLYLSFNVLTWAVISCMIGLGFIHLSTTQSFKYTNLLKYIGIGTIFLITPIFYSQANIFEFLPTFIGLLAGALLFLSLLQFNLSVKDKFDILFILLLGIVIEALLGIAQIYILDLTGLKGTLYGLLNDRPSGIFRQPNVMASFMVTGIFLSLFLWFANIKQKFNKKRKGLIYVALLSTAWVLIPLQSKTGYLALLICLALITIPVIKNFKYFSPSLLTLIIGVILGFLTMTFAQQLDRGEKLYTDGGIRTDIIKVSYDMFKDNPISGYGYGRFEREYITSHYKQMEVNPELQMPVTNLDHPHNEILMWGIEGGVFALLGLLIFSVGFIFMLKGRISDKKIFLITLILPILIHTQTEKPFYLSAVHWFYFITLIWFISEELETIKVKAMKSYLLAKCGGIIIPLLTVPFMLTTIHTSIMFGNFIKSDYQDLKSINSIVNHMAWQKHFEQFFNNSKFYDAFAQNDLKALNEYAIWGYQFVQTTPRAHIYENVILAIKVLQKNNVQLDPDFVSNINKEARTLYPNVKVWGDFERNKKLMNN
jgi:O-antigen polymerase